MADDRESRVGALRRRFQLQAPAEAPDGLGGQVQSFVTVAAFWGALTWRGGEERWRQGRPEQAGSWRVTLRWRPGVDAGMRLVDGARAFDVRTVADPDGSRRRLVCIVEEIGP